MFTGIVESVGIIQSIQQLQHNLIVTIESKISGELKIDQSVAHQGICLTVTACNNHTHTVCAVPETIQKTTIGKWKVGDEINLERCLQFNGRLDGHIVQGHVDSVATCIARKNNPDYWNFTFQIDPQFAGLLIEKGSVCVNGTSLTCFHVTQNSFEVTIIPYTYQHTSIQHVMMQDQVNIEFDVIGKYILRQQSLSFANTF